MSYKHTKAAQKLLRKQTRADRAKSREANIAKRLRKPKFTEKKPRDVDYLTGIPQGAFAYRTIPSLGVETLPPVQTQPHPDAFYDPEWRERERVAKEHAEHLKTCTAPLYSKGPYQLVTADVVAGINKKAGGL